MRTVIYKTEHNFTNVFVSMFTLSHLFQVVSIIASLYAVLTRLIVIIG